MIFCFSIAVIVEEEICSLPLTSAKGSSSASVSSFKSRYLAVCLLAFACSHKRTASLLSTSLFTVFFSSLFVSFFTGSTVFRALIMVEPYVVFIHQASLMALALALTAPSSMALISFNFSVSNSALSVISIT